MIILCLVEVGCNFPARLVQHVFNALQRATWLFLLSTCYELLGTTFQHGNGLQ